MYCFFGELPSDLEEMQESMGPPPAWFRPESGITTPEQAAAAWYSYPYSYYGRGYSGLGDKEAEVEVNPIEELRELKFNQEMNKEIPVEANRYTDINPLSPLFRDKKAKYGYGDYSGTGFQGFKYGIGLMIGIGISVFVYNRFIKNSL